MKNGEMSGGAFSWGTSFISCVNDVHIFQHRRHNRARDKIKLGPQEAECGSTRAYFPIIFPLTTFADVCRNNSTYIFMTE